jgi:TrmH family RNA methyltransferase
MDDQKAASPMPVVILYEPQNPLNIGSVVRACMNCNVEDLRLVKPRVWDEKKMSVTAPHGEEFLREQVTRYDTWEKAVEGIGEAYAFTARGRAERQHRHRLEELLETNRDFSTTAFVFGREDSGLPNDIVDRCHGYITIETSAHYRSLNLAQAVLVALHQCFRTIGTPVKMRPSGRSFKGVSVAAMERLMLQVERSLEEIDFFKGDQHDNVLRTVRRVLMNADMDSQETATMWGIFTEIENAMERARRQSGEDAGSD